MSAGDWSLCLTSRQGRKVVKLSPICSTKDLMDLASAQFFPSTIECLKYGFPKPKPMLVDSTTQISKLMSNQERIQVEFGAEPASNSNSKGKGKKQPTTTTPGRRPKRAAAEKATEEMPAIIKAQEEMMKQQSSPSKKRSRTTTSNNNMTAARNKKKPPPKFTASVGQGRRLADGAKVATPSKQSRGKANNSILSKSKSNDMSEALLGALNDKGKMGRVLRKGMNNAVLASYETTLAFSRLAAIQAKSCIMSQLSDQKLQIEYQGTVDKTQQIETVDCIPQDVLEAVIRGIHASNQEALRPENLALLSPRVLWSLMFYFKSQEQETGSPEDCCKALLPDLDWTFLRRRAQQMSEKAKENQRQEQEAQGGDQMDVEKASDAVAAVEHAMEHLQDYESTERKAKQAQAALARLQQQAESNGDWKLVTPCEPDRDELRECIEQAPPASNDVDISSVITRLMKDCHIRNWRELANVNDTKSLATRLDMPKDIVQRWIDKAQDESVSEIIVEICDGNVGAVEALTETARTGTPKDLAAWRCIPDLLYEQVVVVANGSSSAASSIIGTIDKTMIGTWCQRAHSLLQEREWLNWYATPVE